MPEGRADRSFRITPGTKQASIEGELLSPSAAEINALTGLVVNAVDLNRVSNRGGYTQELTETAVVIDGIYCLDLNHATVAIEASMNPSSHTGFFFVSDTSASGTAAHTLTLTDGGTFDGTNDVATFNAPGEGLLIFFDGTGKGRIILNNGSVALSEAA